MPALVSSLDILLWAGGNLFPPLCEVCVIESEIRSDSGHGDSHDVLFDMKMCVWVCGRDPFFLTPSQ